MSQEPARVKVRVQARDGKILGPAPEVQQPLLSVRNVQTDKVLIPDTGMFHESSGTVVPSSAKFNFAVSRNAIVVEPPGISPTYPPGPYWLEVPPANQGGLIVELPLAEPSLLEFKATAFAPDPVYSSATMWVTPGMQLLDDPGLVLTIAGLYTTVNASVLGGTLSITATVTMMCGCPITRRPPPAGIEPYWPSSEFSVSAQIHPQNGPSQPPFSLNCTDTSTYKGSQDNLGAGTYDVWVVAVQANETNVGFAKATVKVT